MNGLIVTMDWEDLIETDDGDYQPKSRNVAADVADHGTSVRVSKLTRSSDITPADLAESLSRLFQYSDSEVQLKVIGRDGSEIPITRELRVSTVATEFKWVVPLTFRRVRMNCRRAGLSAP